MRSPSPSPQRPETSNSLVPSSSIAGSDGGQADAEGEDEDEEEEEDEPAGVPTEDEIEKLQAKVDQLSLEFGLGDDEEVGDDESREMKGLREMRDLVSYSLLFRFYVRVERRRKGRAQPDVSA